jgi:deazaflavin-dependent oxidoreductase (nitroreductase family)
MCCEGVGVQRGLDVEVLSTLSQRDPLPASVRNPVVMLDKRRLTTALAKHAVNPVVERLVRRGLVGGWAILETVGRKSAEPRRTPVGNGLDGDTFWLVAEHGRRAAYVKNIEADPRVRVCVRGRWRSGTAHLLPADDPRARQRSLPRLNALAVRAMGTELLTIRIDLD